MDARIVPVLDLGIVAIYQHIVPVDSSAACVGYFWTNEHQPTHQGPFDYIVTCLEDYIRNRDSGRHVALPTIIDSEVIEVDFVNKKKVGSQ